MNQPLSFIHPDAEIAANVVVDPFATIANNVKIGEGTWIGSHAVIMEHTVIGKNCKIFPGAVVGAIPQDLKFKGEKTLAIVGDNTTIRECVTINRGTASKNATVVGSDCLLMAYVHVAHDCTLGNNIILGNGVQLAGEVVIDDWAILSAHCLVHQFVHIGGHVMISGASLVRKDVPPFIKAAREPLSYVGVNSIGLRRRNFGNQLINEIQDVYRSLYQKGMNTSQALEYIEAELPASKERDEILLFIRNSKRGMVKGYTSSNNEDID